MTISSKLGVSPQGTSRIQAQAARGRSKGSEARVTEPRIGPRIPEIPHTEILARCSSKPNIGTMENEESQETTAILKQENCRKSLDSLPGSNSTSLIN